MATNHGTRKLTGDHCQCSGCGEYFNSTAAFDKHRTGKHGLDRRCLTVEEMTLAGMVLNKTSFWLTKARPSFLVGGSSRDLPSPATSASQADEAKTGTVESENDSQVEAA